MISINKQTIFIILVFILLATQARAYVASSTNYRIQSDSINTGGATSSSATYNLEDTIGEIGTGTSTSATYNIHAGYQAMQADAYISLSSPSDITLTSFTNTAGGSSASTASWTVITDSSAGYTLSIKASTNPALKSSSDSFADYTPSGAVPDYNWTVGSSASAFGYSPEGDDVASRFKDNGSICGTGSSETDNQCWDGLSTSNTTMAQGSSSNIPSGVATTVRFQAEAGASKNQAVGSYAATITITAVAL